MTWWADCNGGIDMTKLKYLVIILFLMVVHKITSLWARLKS